MPELRCSPSLDLPERGLSGLFLTADKPPMSLSMELVSDTEIRQSGSVKVSLPKIAQKTLNISGDCRVITESISTWIGD